jgi:hypothetical protein
VEVDGARVIVPSELPVELTATRMTLKALVEAAPATCRASGESGLALADKCRAERGALGLDVARQMVDTTPRSGLDPLPEPASASAVAVVTATRDAHGRLVASSLALKKDKDMVWGAVTFVNTAEGYFRMNGSWGVDQDGVIVRLNDPGSRQSVQRGLACGSDSNCSPDGRFPIDPSAPSARFLDGNPACVPSDAAPQACPDSNRTAVPGVAAPVPIRVGDHLKANGSFEIAGGVRFFSAQSLVVQMSLER